MSDTLVCLNSTDGRTDVISVTFASSSNEPFTGLIVDGGAAWWRRARVAQGPASSGRHAPQGADFERVYAAGDATEFAIKHGSIAAPQADTAAQAIAASAGVADEPESFRRMIHGLLLKRVKPRYLSPQVIGGHRSSSELTDTPGWSPATKIVAKYLASYRDKYDLLAATRT